jgi:hypothetical protein
MAVGTPVDSLTHVRWALMGSGGSMEISSFFRMTWRRFVALVVVGLVAALVAGVVALRSPAKYQGSAVMFTAQVLRPGFPQYSLQPMSDNLQNMVFVGSVIDRAARVSGQSVSQIAGSLEAGPAGTNDVQITYSSTDAAAVPVVLKSVAHGALRQLGQTQLDSAQSVLVQAKDDVAKASAALVADEQAHGTASSVAHDSLVDEVNRTRGALSDANGAVGDAQAILTRAKLGSVIAVSGASKESQTSDVARAAATAGVAAVALLLLAIFVSDWRRSGEDELMREARRRSRQRPEGLLGDPLNTRDRDRKREQGRAAGQR